MKTLQITKRIADVLKANKLGVTLKTNQFDLYRRNTEYTVVHVDDQDVLLDYKEPV